VRGHCGILLHGHARIAGNVSNPYICAPKTGILLGWDGAPLKVKGHPGPLGLTPSPPWPPRRPSEARALPGPAQTAQPCQRATAWRLRSVACHRREIPADGPRQHQHSLAAPHWTGRTAFLSPTAKEMMVIMWSSGSRCALHAAPGSDPSTGRPGPPGEKARGRDTVGGPLPRAGAGGGPGVRASRGRRSRATATAAYMRRAPASSPGTTRPDTACRKTAPSSPAKPGHGTTRVETGRIAPNHAEPHGKQAKTWPFRGVLTRVSPSCHVGKAA